MSVAERAQEMVAPYTDADPAGILAGLIAGLVAPLEICDVASDTDTHIAWGQVLDPDAAPAPLLPWLSQFSGDRFLPGDTEQQKRDSFTSPSNFFRGTVEAIKAEIRTVLVPSAPGAEPTVVLLDFVGGNQFAVTIITLTSETPDAAAVIAAAKRQLAPWLIVTYVVSNDPIIDQGTRTIDASAGVIDTATTADIT